MCLFGASPTSPRLDPGCLSNGPGVEIPNTMLGASRLALLVVIPRISSSNNPCDSNTSARGCRGLGTLVSSPVAVSAFTLYSATGSLLLESSLL